MPRSVLYPLKPNESRHHRCERLWALSYRLNVALFAQRRARECPFRRLTHVTRNNSFFRFDVHNTVCRLEGCASERFVPLRHSFGEIVLIVLNENQLQKTCGISISLFLNIKQCCILNSEYDIVFDFRVSFDVCHCYSWTGRSGG